KLEGELCTRLLHRTPGGVVPTDAGTAFFREARLTLRHADQAVRAAQEARLSGTVSVGLAPTTGAMLGLPLMQAMQQYPNIRLHLVESMSGHLTTMLIARELDLAILFDSRPESNARSEAKRLWQPQPLLTEDLFLISRRTDAPQPATVTIAQLGSVPLILPTDPHGLRNAIDAAFARAKTTPCVALEIDSLAMVMAAVDAGLGSTIQPHSAIGRYPDAAGRFAIAKVDDPQVRRMNLLSSLPEAELSPAALATRGVLRSTAKTLVHTGA